MATASWAMAKVSLEVVSDDQLAVVQILDEGLNLLKTGIGSVQHPVNPGFYRAQLVTPEGRKASEIVWLPPGSGATTVPLATPEPSSNLAWELVRGAGFEIGSDNKVRIPIDLAATTAALLAVTTPAAAVAFVLAAQAMTRLDLVTMPSTASCGLRVLLACEGGECSEIVRDVRIRIWRQGSARPGEAVGLQPNRRFEAIAGFAQAFDAGSYWVQISSPRLNVNWVASTSILPGYETTLVIEGQDARDVGVNCVIVPRQASAENVEWHLKQNLTQRALHAGRLDLAREYAFSLRDSASHEPLSGCLMGYALLGAGLTEHGGIGAYITTFRERFPLLSDAQVLLAASARGKEPLSRCETAYLQAARLGVPIFAEGLRWLAAGCKELLDKPPELRRVPGEKRVLEKIQGYRKAMVRRQHLTILNADELWEWTSPLAPEEAAGVSA